MVPTPQPAQAMVEPPAEVSARGPVDFAVWVLNRFESLDDWLDGKRLWILGSLVVLAAIPGRILDMMVVAQWPRALPLFAFGLTLLLGFVAALIGLGRLCSFREEGRWSSQVALRHAWDALSLGWNRVVVFFEMPAHARFSAAGRLGVVLSLLALSVLNVEPILREAWLMVSRQPEASVREWSQWSMALNAAAWVVLMASAWLLWRGRRMRREASVELATQQATRLHAQHGVAPTAGLPLLVDCKQSDANKIADQITDAEVAEFLRTVAGWKPGPGREEADYHSALRKRLQKSKLTSVKPEPRINKRADGTYDKPDLLINGKLVVEMKAQIGSHDQADRAVGQIQRYWRSWSEGPVLLLLCDYQQNTYTESLVQRIKAQSPPTSFCIVIAP